MDPLSDDDFEHVDSDLDLSDAENITHDGLDTPSTTPPRGHTPSQSAHKTKPCPYCSKSFNRNARLTEHIRSHTNERPFVCTHVGCSKAFLRDTHLKHHLKSAHSDIRDYHCSWEGCDKSFATGTRLRRHLEAHQGREKYRCRGYDGCNKTFRKHETLRKHILTEHEHNPKPFSCDHVSRDGSRCDQSFDREDRLRAHQRALHDDTKYVCTMCSADGTAKAVSFATFAELQSHLATYHLPTCPHCRGAFRNNKELDRHLELVHGLPSSSTTATQQWPCTYPDCTHLFSKKGNLNVHIRTVHEKQRNFICGQTEVSINFGSSAPDSPQPGCGQAFSSKASLEEHVRVKHLNLPRKQVLRRLKRKAEQEAHQDSSTVLTSKRRAPRKDKGVKKTSALSGLSGLISTLPSSTPETMGQPTNLSVAAAASSYQHKAMPTSDALPATSYEDDWNQLSGSMTIVGSHLYHNGQGFHYVSENNSVDQELLDQGQYIACEEPTDSLQQNMAELEPFFDFDHEPEFVRNLDPALLRQNGHNGAVNVAS